MTSGPVFRARTHGIGARLPRPPRGRIRSGPGVLPPGTVVNQWTGTFAQPASFQTTPPALQGVPVSLTPANGTGWPTPGNWLFCIVGMSEQAAAAGFTVGVGDDIHSFWRPGDETASTWAVSAPSGLTRTAIWYTANTARQAGYVYVAPSGCLDAMSVLVVEVSGLGPWDTVTGISTNYAAAATTLNLALGAPSGAAFTIAAVAGDSTAAGQAFAPAGWVKLNAVSATNGSDHTSDCALTSAVLNTTAGSLSVNGTASSATDLSGVMLQVLQNAPSPVPAAQNPDWPYLKFEAAFGGGFQTPQDSLTWTDLTSRLYSWSETTGIQYQLGQIQATQLSLELNNNDNALASDNVGSPYYSTAMNSNMSFQSGTSPWTAQNGATITQSGTYAYASSLGATAQYSLKVTPDGVTATPNAYCENVAISATGTYSGSAWFLCPAGYATGAQVAINWFNSSHTYLSTSTVAATALPASSTTWTQVTILGQSPPGSAAYANIDVQLSGTPSAATVFYVAEAALVAGTSAVSTGLVTTGTPLRIRAALGTIGGVTVNRWYVISRNAEEWAQQVDPAYQRRIAATGTDIWSVLSSSGPSPYRGEVEQDSPYAWWPCDDQPLTGGVQPTTLRNAAQGNTNTLAITASPNGVSAQDSYSTGGTDLNNALSATPLPSVATYAVGQNQGWMYGDPQSSPQSYSTGNPVTSNPGSAAWQQSGALGTGGGHGWFLAVNDTNFPPLSGGVTVKGWFNAAFFGTAVIYQPTAGTDYLVAGQPYAPLTLCTLSTGSAPVVILQLDRATGHLNLITYNGTTPTTHTVYSSSDLRSASWHCVDITLTQTTWAVYVNGGLTATASGSVSAMTSAWTWLTLNGDYGNTHGGTTPASIENGGNVLLSHWAVFPEVLPAWRLLAHYCAAITGFGVIPAPVPQVSWVATGPTGGNNTTFTATPDGTVANGLAGTANGAYGGTGLGSASTVTLSALATINAGSYTSGPSPRAILANTGVDISGTTYGGGIWVSWTGVGPLFTVYTAASANAETGAGQAAGSGDSFSTGYGASASGHGACQTASGSGASPPSSASSLGDTVQQRLERILGYANATYPGRLIDPASLAVQAATDIGGQQTGQNLVSIAQSDGGLLAVDNLGSLAYFQKSHLAGQYASPAWTLTPVAPPTAGAPATAIPYARDFDWTEDPQKVWNAILITPFSPDGSSLADITPSQAALVDASQRQYGPQPRQITSYLQSQTEMQNQADWMFTNFGQARIRVDGVHVDAAPYPAAFPMILGVNVGDVVTMQNWQIGGGGLTGTFRVTQIRRKIAFGGDDPEDDPEASVTLTLDPEPSSYWS